MADEVNLPVVGCKALEVSQDEIKSALEQIAETHTTVKKIHENTQHLEKLDDLAGAVGTLAIHAGDIKDSLLTEATAGKDAFLLKVVGWLVAILMMVILSLLLVIGTLLIGERFGIIRELWKSAT